MRCGLAAGFLALSLALVTGAARAEALGTIRIGTLKFGTVSWELDVIQHHGLDRKAGFTLDVQGFGGNDAADVALLGGAVDGIVEDWLWVSRQRASGLLLTFIPYSSSIGSLVVRADSGIDRLEDLKGKRIGVAGGPLDKSWILIRGAAKERAGIDLARDAEPVYGAPPLLAEKLRQGELPAVLEYWNYAAGLVAEGHRSLISVNEAEQALGVPGSTVQLGYVFKEGWADDHRRLVQAFSDASRGAKRIMAHSDAEWQRLRPLTRAPSDAVLDALMTSWRAGIPERWGTPEREAAAKLYAVLARLGGEALVGDSPTLAPGTFWDGERY
jgi:NitT/TauT family transport system substrate-binding protein